MYAEEGPYTIDVFVWRALRNFALADFEKNVEEMVGTTREAVDGDRVRRERDGDETGCPGYETGDKTAATAGDERDGSATCLQVAGLQDYATSPDGVMYTEEGELEFDEDEMAALEGQRLVAKFRCGMY